MKNFTFLLASIIVSGNIVLAQNYDDVYFKPGKDDKVPAEQPKQDNKTEQNSYNDEGYYVDPDDYDLSDNNAKKQSETTYDEQGNTYITNNYYGDYNDYESDYTYTTRMRRYYEPYYGFGYYSPCYTTYYYDYYDPWYSSGGYFGNYYGGWSFSFGYSYPYNYGHYYPNYYGGNYYNGGWGGHHHGYGHGYYHGYNDGYYHGYNDGYYDYYGNSGYYGSGSSNTYYGPRSGSSGISSYRSPDGSGKTSSQIGKILGNSITPVKIVPVRETKAVETAKPVVKDVNTIRQEERPAINQYTRDPKLAEGQKVNPVEPTRGEIKTAEPKTAVPSETQTPRNIDKSNGSNAQTPVRTGISDGNRMVIPENQNPQKQNVTEPVNRNPQANPNRSQPDGQNSNPQRYAPAPSNNSQPKKYQAPQREQNVNPAPQQEMNRLPDSPEPKNVQPSQPSRNSQPRSYTPDRNENGGSKTVAPARAPQQREYSAPERKSEPAAPPRSSQPRSFSPSKESSPAPAVRPSAPSGGSFNQGAERAPSSAPLRAPR